MPKIQNPSILGSDVDYMSSTTYEIEEEKETLFSLEGSERSILTNILTRVRELEDIDVNKLIELLMKFPSPKNVNPEIFYLAFTFQYRDPKEIKDLIGNVSWLKHGNRKAAVEKSLKNLDGENSIVYDIIRYIQILNK